MKKKIVSMVLLSVLVLVLVGCGGPKPEDTVNKYLTAAKVLDTETMATCILPSNEEDVQSTKDITDTEKDGEYPTYFKDYMTDSAKKMTYSITETKVTDDKAVVTVKCKYIDGGPLLKATIGEAFTKMLGSAFSGVEQTEEETNEMFVSIMKEQSELLGEKYKENTFKINCKKQDDNWYIAEVNNDLEDVVTLGFASVGADLEDSFGGTSDSTDDSDNSIMEQAKEDHMTIIEKSVGDDITLASIKLKVNNVEEKNTISATYSDPTDAKDGAKFIVINMDITNITNKEFTFYTEDITAIDNKGREYKPFDDTIGAIDDYIDCRDLSPSIKESGNLVYEVPADATSYYLAIGKAGTNELYKINLK